VKWFIFRVEMNCIIKGARLCCMTVQAPNTPTTLEIEFEKGDPVAINGVRMSPATILTKLNEVRYVWLHMCVCVCLYVWVWRRPLFSPSWTRFVTNSCSCVCVCLSVCVSMKEATILTKLNEVRYVWLHMCVCVGGWVCMCNYMCMSPATVLTKLNEVRYVWLHMLCVSVCMSMKVSIPNFGQFKSPAHVYVSVCVSMKESIPDFGQFGSPLPSTACAHVSCNPTNSAETKSAGLKCSKHARVLISLSHCVEERRVLAYSVPSMHAYWSYCVEKRRVLAQSVLSMHACWSHCIGFMCWV